MSDPVAQIVAMLEPGPGVSKRVYGAGAWMVRRAPAFLPFYCAVLEGSCRLATAGGAEVLLGAGDFVLVPDTAGFVMKSRVAAGEADLVPNPVRGPDNVFHIGRPGLSTDVKLQIGHCSFQSPDAAVLASLLPALVHVRQDARLSTLVALVADEVAASRPAQDVVLRHLLELLLIEALRAAPEGVGGSGLLRGLADRRLAPAIRSIHADPAGHWTIPRLARQASLSRSAFCARFLRVVGMTPNAYLTAWRMAVSKRALRDGSGSISEIAERVGYGSVASFSTAFARSVGMSPARYARAGRPDSTAAGQATPDHFFDDEISGD